MLGQQGPGLSTLPRKKGPSLPNPTLSCLLHFPFAMTLPGRMVLLYLTCEDRHLSMPSDLMKVTQRGLVPLGLQSTSSRELPACDCLLGIPAHGES